MAGLARYTRRTGDRAVKGLAVKAPVTHLHRRRTYGIIAIAQRHPRLFARLVARVQRPLERLSLEDEL